MFEKFGDYMFHLLFSPLKKARKNMNQFYIFFKVIGKVFDKSKDDFVRVNDESTIITCGEEMLNEFGKERDMPRLNGEDIETYRTRLCMKEILARKAGTNEALVLCATSLGYDKSFVEPLYKYDPERWAEVVLFLSGEKASGINDLSTIDDEIRKVKQASCKVNYGMYSGNQIRLKTSSKHGQYIFPMCGMVICGTYPGVIR